MNYNLDGWPLQEVRDKILVAAAEQNHQTHRMPLVELAKGYTKDGVTIEGEKYVLTEFGLKQLWGERLDATGLATFKRLSPRVQKSVLVDLSDDKEVTVQTSIGQVDAVLGADYQPIPNNFLAIILGQALPEDAMVHRWSMSDDARTLDLRVVCKDTWKCDLGNGRPDPGFGGLHISNNETGGGVLSVRHAVARVGCLNYVITQETVLEQQHRYVNAEALKVALEQGIMEIPEYTERIAEEMRGWRKIPVDDPVLAMERVQERGGIPQYAMADAREYWEEQGSEHNLFQVMQALSHGLKRTTDDTPARVRANWDRRNRLEEFIMEEAVAVEEHGSQHWYECAACHQALPETA